MQFTAFPNIILVLSFYFFFFYFFFCNNITLSTIHILFLYQDIQSSLRNHFKKNTLEVVIHG